MSFVVRSLSFVFVALLAEGVDRNLSAYQRSAQRCGSPSSRRAWIEMFCVRRWILKRTGRPPRGGRG